GEHVLGNMLPQAAISAGVCAGRAGGWRRTGGAAGSALAVAAVVLAAAAVLRRVHGDEGDAAVVLVALGGLAGADALREGLRRGGVVLVAVEHDGLLLALIGGADADLGPAVDLQ